MVGEDIKLNVKPIPIDYQGQWLPSELLSLHQEWQPSPDEFKVGEPITRTITLTVAGLSEEQLPEINYGNATRAKSLSRSGQLTHGK